MTAEAPDTGAAKPVRAAAPDQVELVVSGGPGPGELTVDRPAADWADFAPAPARHRRIRPPMVVAVAAGARHLHRAARREWVGAAVTGVALSLIVNRDALADPNHRLPPDPAGRVSAYLVAWAGHEVRVAPGNLWQLNGFFPAGHSLAFGDALLGYAPFGLVGAGPAGAVLRANVLLVAAGALAFVGAFALARQLGVGRIAAAAAGTGLAMAPWHLARAGDLALLSGGAVALTLAMLARGHGLSWRRSGTGRPGASAGWAIAGWLGALWTASVSLATGAVLAAIVFVGLAVGIGRWGFGRAPEPGRRLLLVDGIGTVAYAATLIALAVPYRDASDQVPAGAAPPLRGLLTAPAGSLIWGDAHAGARALLPHPEQMTLLPGYALIAIAVAGVFFSVWSWTIRGVLVFATAVTVVVALGPTGPGGASAGWVLDHLPGASVRGDPGRLIMWITLALVLLGTGGVAALVQRAVEVARERDRPRPSMPARLALLLPAALLLVEGLGTLPWAPVPARPAGLDTVVAPYLVLPSDPHHDADVLLWSTVDFASVANGSGARPVELDQIRQAVATFPDQRSVDYLRQLGIRRVVIPLPAPPSLADLVARPDNGPGFTSEVRPEMVIFQIT